MRCNFKIIREKVALVLMEVFDLLRRVQVWTWQWYSTKSKWQNSWDNNATTQTWNL